MRNKKLSKLVVTALLCSVAIIIPIFSPLKIVLEPASFTLASHVPIFIALFISPVVAAAVSLISAIGFFMGGFPIVVVFRAVSHVIFAVSGGLFLRKTNGMTLKSMPSAIIFSLIVSIVHAVGELLVVIPFYFSNNMSQGYYIGGFITSIIMLVGLGTIIHSMVDFFIALTIWKTLDYGSRLKSLT